MRARRMDAARVEARSEVTGSCGASAASDSIAAATWSFGEPVVPVPAGLLDVDQARRRAAGPDVRTSWTAPTPDSEARTDGGQRPPVGQRGRGSARGSDPPSGRRPRRCPRSPCTTSAMRPVSAHDISAAAEVSRREDRGRAAHPRRTPRRVLAVMCVGMFLVLLDVTIVNVALPSIAAGLHGDVAALQWVMDGYAVAIAGLLLTGGTLGDRFGHRRVLLAGLAVFGVGIGRVRYGAGHRGARSPRGSSRASGERCCCRPRWRSSRTSSPTAPRRPARWAPGRRCPRSRCRPARSSAALLVDAASWRLVFWINVPVVARRSGRAMRTVPASRPRRDGRFDVAGTVALALGADRPRVHGDRSRSRCERGGDRRLGSRARVLALGVALRVERRAARPGAAAGSAAPPGVPGAQLRRDVDESHLQRDAVRRRRSTCSSCAGTRRRRAGLLVLPLAVPLVALAPLSGRLTAARGPRTAVAAGCLVAAAGPPFLLGVGPARGTAGW